MKILHITPHMGGGVGAVIRNWLSNDKEHKHVLLCLDYANDQTKEWAIVNGIQLYDKVNNDPARIANFITWSDIVVVHYWDHPMLMLLLEHWPVVLKYRYKLIFWIHKNGDFVRDHYTIPNVFVSTSPVILDRLKLKENQLLIYKHNSNTWVKNIWSVADMSKFRDVTRIKSNRFCIGYVGTVDYKKAHFEFLEMLYALDHKDMSFSFIGEININIPLDINKDDRFMFFGQVRVDDIPHHLQYMDVFGYPLQPFHYGTCEQVLGEAMSAGVVPVVMDNPAERLIIRDGYNGFIARHPADYIAKIELLYQHPRMRQRMSDNARKSAAKLYNTRTMIESWNKLFREIRNEK